jgi:hypothetical protein
MASKKFNVGDRVFIWKRGREPVSGTVFKIGENKAEGYYYIDLDNGDRLLYAEKELAFSILKDVIEPTETHTPYHLNWWESENKD